MKEYERVEIEVVVFDSDDIVTSSPCSAQVLPIDG